MLGDLDRKRLRNGLQGLSVPLELILHRGEGHALDQPLAKAAEQVAEAADGAITVREARRDDLPAAPGMVLSYRGRDNLRYLAVPHGPETPPYLDALLGLAGGAVATEGEWARPLAGLKLPAELLVFIGPTCPHCPRAVRAASRIALVHPLVTTTIIDAEQFGELALRYAARSVPLTVLDGEWTHVGVMPAEDLVQRILSRGTPEHEAAVLQSLLEVGRTTSAGQDLARGRRVQALLELWKKSATSERIGLMLASETALEQEPRCLDPIVSGLCAVLDVDDATLRGDTADLLGQIGDPSALPALEALLGREDNPDVKEIAEEALEVLKDESSRVES